MGRKITVTLAASIKDAHKTASKVENPLILLTFLPWHLLRRYNTKRRHPSGCLFVLVAETRSVLHDLRVIPTSVARWVAQNKTIEYRFIQALSPKQGVDRAESKRSVEARGYDYATGPGQTDDLRSLWAYSFQIPPPWPNKALVHNVSRLFSIPSSLGFRRFQTNLFGRFPCRGKYIYVLFPIGDYSR